MSPDQWTDDQIENYNERAGVLEYEAGMDREAAELMAIELIFGGG
jgi:hypothetical protein